jgi:hypothetical protein
VLVRDIETVPDLVGFAAGNGYEGKSEDEIRAEVGDKFSSTSTLDYLRVRVDTPSIRSVCKKIFPPDKTLKNYVNAVAFPQRRPQMSRR